MFNRRNREEREEVVRRPRTALMGLIGGAAIIAVGVGSFFAGRESASEDEEDRTVPQVVTQTGNKAAELCGESALWLATENFPVTTNDPSTPEDELYNSGEAMDPERQALTDELFSECMDEEFYTPATDFNPEAPKVPKTVNTNASAVTVEG